MVATKLGTIYEIRRAQRADGPAAVLAIGTANPTFSIPQDKFPDYYFRVTKKEHLTDLKDTFTKLCKKTGLERRFFHHTEQMLNANPSFFLDGTPSSSSSLDARLDIVSKAAPELAAAAAAKAIAMWGRPATDITDLIVATSSEARSPGTDLSLASLLGLRPDVRRTSLQLAGCSAGCAALRLAKDLAENNRGARVLVACVELNLTSFRAPPLRRRRRRRHRRSGSRSPRRRARDLRDGGGVADHDPGDGEDAEHAARGGRDRRRRLRRAAKICGGAPRAVPGRRARAARRHRRGGWEEEEVERALLGGPPGQPWDPGPHRRGSPAGAWEAGGEPRRRDGLREHDVGDGDICARRAAAADGGRRR
ncbi:hypothetical protein HU200_016362 [Digitaria exilis]|uniref:Chalcone/stilbene synthase N-terminal domain-containing protein n=1 Tax=Digitaria exilis TaxID=1010633 RepID=A0A835KJT9_9POAL|nr:hypothetical protein HU200_016362 [Digitaria exilis]